MSTLLLSGWAQPADALAHLAKDAVLFDYSDYADVESAIAALASIPHRQVIAWSLGGQLALRALAAGAIAPGHLTLIAAPIQFVSDDAALPGMGEETYRLFRDSYASDAARTMARFHGLIAKGERDMRRVMGLLRHHPQTENTARWLPWLEGLARYKHTPTDLANPPPTLIIHGMHDQIVPYAQSERLAASMKGAALSLWPEVGHAPHLHDAARLRAEIVAHRALHGVAA